MAWHHMSPEGPADSRRVGPEVERVSRAFDIVTGPDQEVLAPNVPEETGPRAGSFGRDPRGGHAK